MRGGACEGPVVVASGGTGLEVEGGAVAGVSELPVWSGERCRRRLRLRSSVAPEASAVSGTTSQVTSPPYWVSSPWGHGISVSWTTGSEEVPGVEAGAAARRVESISEAAVVSRRRRFNSGARGDWPAELKVVG